jgi:hypothetical protein
MLDELRDYRFYKEDYLHPNNQAINYIWRKFQDAYCNKKTLETIIKVREIKDGKEIETYKKLTDLSSEQLKATIEAEKNRPQDIEDVQRDQLTTQEGMLANLKEINENK